MECPARYLFSKAAGRSESEDLTAEMLTAAFPIPIQKDLWHN
jgi:hypothetical protein